MFVKHFILLFIGILTGCANNSQVAPKHGLVEAKSEKIRIHTSAINFPKQEEHQNYKFVNCVTYHEQSYLVLFSKEENKLVSYNLEKGYNSTLQFGSFDPSIITSKIDFNSDSSFYSIGTDFVLEKVTSSNMEVIGNMNEPLRENKLAIEHPRISRNFHVSDSLIFFPLHIDPYSKGYVQPYDYPMTATYNLKTKELKTTGILYPKHYHKQNYGLLRTIHQVYTPHNTILYNPSAQDQIWEYDLSTDSIYKHTFRSKYQQSEIQSITFKSTPKTKDLLVKHRDLSGEYGQLVYDPYKKVYYRFYKHFRKEKGEDGFYLTYRDNTYSVIVADEQFNILGEVILPSQCFFIFFAYPTPKGLFINDGPLFGEKNDQINVRKITFDFID